MSLLRLVVLVTICGVVAECLHRMEVKRVYGISFRMTSSLISSAIVNSNNGSNGSSNKDNTLSAKSVTKEIMVRILEINYIVFFISLLHLP